MALTNEDVWFLKYLAKNCKSPDQFGKISIERKWQRPDDLPTMNEHTRAIGGELGLSSDEIYHLVSNLREMRYVGVLESPSSLEVWITEEGQDTARRLFGVPHNESASTGVEIDVLISWSKHQSREIATVFHQWIPKVLPGVTPWMSDLDIDKGTDWWDELKGLLTRAKMCIICITKENVRSPWLYFETGAIAGKRERVRVFPYLLGIGPNMLSDGPLGKYQCTATTKKEMLSLIRSLNKALDPSKKHDDGLLEGNFQNGWPEFEAELQRVLAMDADDEDEFVETDADEIAGCNLSSEARTVLIEVSRDKGGVVMYARHLGGTIIQTNGRDLAEAGNVHRVALLKQAIDDLVACGLLEDQSGKGELFGLTGRGYKAADSLRD